MTLAQKIVQTAAKLWGVAEARVHLVRQEDTHILVYAWMDEEDPDAGMYNRRVDITCEGEPSAEHIAEVHMALLDVLEGALRRKEASEARVARSFN